MISIIDVEKMVTGSSIDKNGIEVLCKLVETYQPKQILELGSGVSTLAFLLNNEHFNVLYSVDDSSEYLTKTIESIPQKLRNKCRFIHAPINTQKLWGYPFEVYDKKSIVDVIEDKIDLLFIDGPYARRYGRIGTLLIISEYLNNNAIIVLDDANRETEKKAIIFWKQIWGDELELLETYDFRKGLSVFRLKNPHEKKIMPFGFKRWFRAFLS